MRICLVSREYPTEAYTGGIGVFTQKLARGLARLGQSVDVITETSRAAAAPFARVEDGVVVHWLARPRARPGSLARAWAVTRAIRALPQPPDIVQASEFRAEAVWYALRKDPATKLVTRLATPTYLVQRLGKHSASSSPPARTARTYVIDQLERLQARRSDAIVSNGAALADVVCKEWGISRQRVLTIRNGVDFAARFARVAAELPPRLQGKEYLLYFGRLEERKGVHVLAQALPPVLAAHPWLHVVFVGTDMPYRGEPMRRFVERCNLAFLDRLHFFPQLHHPQLFPLLDHALLAVLPSLWEAVGNAALEALDMGTPVVATSGCGFGELVDDGLSGVLVPPGDVAALQQALVSLLRDRTRLATMAGAARARAACFQQSEMARQYLELYHGLATGTAPSDVPASGHPTPALVSVASERAPLHAAASVPLERVAEP